MELVKIVVYKKKGARLAAKVHVSGLANFTRRAKRGQNLLGGMSTSLAIVAGSRSIVDDDCQCVVTLGI